MHRRYRPAAVAAAAAAVFGFVLGDALRALLSSPLGSRGGDAEWLLIVEVTFASAADAARAEAYWAPLARYCEASEAGTLTYEMARSDKPEEPLKRVFVERYTDKAAYARVHRSSPAFLKFRKQLSDLAPQITGGSYVRTGIGHWS